MSRTDELIKRVLELDAAATPGPWFWELDWVEDEGTQERPIGTEVFSIRSRDPNGSARTQFDKAWASGEDGALVAEYRTLTPLLARMLRRALEELRSVANLDDGFVFDDDLVFAAGVSQNAEDAIEEIEAMA